MYACFNISFNKHYYESPEPTIYPYVYALHLSGVVVEWSECRAPPVHPITYHTS